MSSIPPPPPPPPPPPGGFSQGGYPPSYPPAAPPPGYQMYGMNTPPNLAGFWVRVGGSLMDSILYGLAGSIFTVPGFILGVAAFKDCDRITDANGVSTISCAPGQLKGGLLAAGIALGVVGFLLVAILYFRALGRTGQTWGRKIVGIRVVSATTGQPLGVGKAILRQIVESIVSGNCLFLGYLWMLWDQRKQTWHDKIVDSVVVRA
jgi:uncharacterized RDD family membrane protein YckC